MITGNEPFNPCVIVDGEDEENMCEVNAPGITLRQHFALEAMKILLAKSMNRTEWTIAIDAVCLADELIKQLNKNETIQK